jgi:hypothetical protein
VVIPLGLTLRGNYTLTEDSKPKTSRTYPMATQDRPFPVVPLSLLDRLEEIYPASLPTFLPTEVETARMIGRQDVIRKLRTEYDRQNQNILTSND